MKEAVVAKAYAKSIYELGESSNTDITGEFTTFNELINGSNDFEILLFSDAFTIEEKQEVLNSVLSKGSLSPLLKNALNYLLAEQRIGLLPLIYKDMVVLDDHKKGFLRGTIEGSEDTISNEFAEQMKSYLKNKVGGEPKLEYKKNEKITGGYRVTVDDLQLDATIDNQLSKLKEEILNS